MIWEPMTKTAIAFALIALAVLTAPPVTEAREEVLVEVTSISASTHALGRAAQQRPRGE